MGSKTPPRFLWDLPFSPSLLLDDIVHWYPIPPEITYFLAEGIAGVARCFLPFVYNFVLAFP